ncbi:MAG TPA: HPF/RaiA family ribosome-associated protein [Labilithrix sp.]|nr:HPF/RaiA family ribosome-associated protein [Labilithrix sp.]
MANQSSTEVASHPSSKRPRRGAAARRQSFARRTARADKRTGGATEVSATALRIHVSGVELDAAEKKRVRERLGRKLERFGPDITRAVVRFEDVNGPRGGVDTVCRIKLSVSGMDHLLVEARSTDARAAFREASNAIQKMVVRAMDRLGRNAKAVGRMGKASREDAVHDDTEERHGVARRPEGGSLIGRRVGRSRANLLRAAERPEKERRDAWVDTSLPGVSASDRKAGGGSTAARNTRLRAPRATATLEDSAQDRPSRKSTRRSANRQKSGTKLERRQKRAVHAPSARARRSD